MQILYSILFLMVPGIIAMEREVSHKERVNGLTDELRLISAIESKNLPEVRNLIESGVRANIVIRKNGVVRSTLAYAAKTGDLALFEYIATYYDSADHFTVSEAIKSGNLQVVKKAYEKFREEDVSSLLIDAARLGDSKVFEFFESAFRKRGKKITECPELLHALAQSGNIELFKKVHVPKCKLEKGQKHHPGQTVLHCAVLSTNIEMFNHVYMLNPSLLTEKDDAGKTVLHYAIDIQNYALCQRIISLKRELLFEKDNRNRTPLMFAAFKGNSEIFELFLKEDTEKKLIHILSSAEENILYNHIEQKIITDISLLQSSARSGNLKIFKTIYEQAPELLFKKASDGTPVLFAAACGSLELFEYVYSLDRTQLTFIDAKYAPSPLHVAALKGNVQIFKRIYELRPELLRSSHTGVPMLFFAASGNIDIFKFVEKIDSRLVGVTSCGDSLLTKILGSSSHNEMFFYIANRYPFLLQYLRMDNGVQKGIFEEALGGADDEIVVFLCQDLMSFGDGANPFLNALFKKFKEHLLSKERDKGALMTLFREMSRTVLTRSQVPAPIEQKLDSEKLRIDFQLLKKLFFSAIKSNDWDVVKSLLSTYKELLLDAQDEDGKTVFLIASLAKNESLIEYLIDFTADLECKRNTH